MPARFLILGASSFYGSVFADYVQERGDSVTLERRYTPFFDEADCVVNFCSKSLVAESWDQPREWLDVNTSELTSLIRINLDTCERFVHVSTPESYGNTDGWVDEDYAEWRPSTPYGVSRAAADMMLMAYKRAYGFPAIITRTANIYGLGQQPYRVIPTAFATLRRGEKMLLHGHGHTVRCFIHVRDACAGLYKVCKEGSVGLTYHISTNRDITINNLVRKIALLLGKRPEDCIGSQPDRPGKDPAYLLKSDRLRRMGWRDTITLEKGLQQWVEN